MDNNKLMAARAWARAKLAREVDRTASVGVRKAVASGALPPQHALNDHQLLGALDLHGVAGASAAHVAVLLRGALRQAREGVPA